MSIMISTPLVIGPGSVTAEMMDSGTATVGQVLTADGAGGADYTAPAGGSPGYLEYVALLSQTNTDAPVATVLKNTLGGTVVWTRFEAGVYFGTLTGMFPVAKTVCSPQVLFTSSGNVNTRSDFFRANDNAVEVDTGGSDSELFNTTIEIRVYP